MEEQKHRLVNFLPVVTQLDDKTLFSPSFRDDVEEGSRGQHIDCIELCD